MLLGLAIVAIWAFAEAIVFFIVADVPITYLAVRRGWRVATVAAIVAAIAAVPGGAIVYLWTASDPGAVRDLFIALPGIDAAMVERTADAYYSGGFAAMFEGSFSGVPYKLFAASAGAGSPPDASMLGFLLASFFARAPRFVIVGLGTALISGLLGRRMSLRARLLALTLGWIVFYTWYFATMPG